ncbi:hypothetical protein HAX54_009026 [Datura stramonium]|uniref:Uncharacterized protein n=1 Tax=Datura stramonium TaxID=4076 RepID=A0ABS8TE80_DATST|nr:hypothetical protein [Datura stramonium]
MGSANIELNNISQLNMEAAGRFLRLEAKNHVSEEVDLLSITVVVANYLKSLVTQKHHERMNVISFTCLLNESAQANARASVLASEGLQSMLEEHKKLMQECEKLN